MIAWRVSREPSVSWAIECARPPASVVTSDSASSFPMLAVRLIPDFLWHGAEAYGFRGDVWSASRVAVVIERTFGVHYHRDHVGRLLREAGWSR